MSEEFEEYVTFTVKTSDGEDMELAVVDEFEFEKKNYVVGARVKDDAIDEEECYLYKVKANTEEFEVEKLRNQFEYNKVMKAYMEMEQEEE